jgi:hypothetical protein
MIGFQSWREFARQDFFHEFISLIKAIYKWIYNFSAH